MRQFGVAQLFTIYFSNNVYLYYKSTLQRLLVVLNQTLKQNLPDVRKQKSTTIIITIYRDVVIQYRRLKKCVVYCNYKKNENVLTSPDLKEHTIFKHIELKYPDPQTNIFVTQISFLLNLRHIFFPYFNFIHCLLITKHGLQYTVHVQSKIKINRQNGTISLTYSLWLLHVKNYIPMHSGQGRRSTLFVIYIYALRWVYLWSKRRHLNIFESSCHDKNIQCQVSDLRQYHFLLFFSISLFYNKGSLFGMILLAQGWFMVNTNTFFY